MASTTDMFLLHFICVSQPMTTASQMTVVVGDSMGPVLIQDEYVGCKEESNRVGPGACSHQQIF